MIDQTPHGLLVRAALAQRLAACFRYPREGTAEALREAVAPLATSSRPFPPLAAAVERLAAALASVDDDALQAAYSRRFIGTAAAPLHETAYGPPRLTTAAELADVQGFYRAFGFELSADAPDLADHLGAELEFHAALLAKLAWATLQELDEAREVTASAAVSFLDAHLGRWTGALAARLAADASDTVYDRLASAAASFVAAECERFGVSPVPLASREGRGEEEGFTCPHAATCTEGVPPRPS
jgi:putative dimethyl sulfoxide reductase chaperone